MISGFYTKGIHIIEDRQCFMALWYALYVCVSRKDLVQVSKGLCIVVFVYIQTVPDPRLWALAGNRDIARQLSRY